MSIISRLRTFLAEDKPKGLGEVALADPSQLFSTILPYNPSALVTRKGLGIYDEMLNDDQVKAALTFKKHTVMATGWDIMAPEGFDDNWPVREEVERQIKELDGSFTYDLLEIMSALDYGYSVTEKVWEQKDKVTLRALKTRRPHEFLLYTDQHGNLEKITQQAAGGEKEIPLSNTILFTYNRRFQNLYGKSDLESAYDSWWAKTNSKKWLAMYLERFGIPPVFLMYNPGPLSDTDKTNLKKLIKNMQASTAGTIPREKPDDMEFWSPEIGGQIAGAFIPALDMYNKDIARAILMPGTMGLTPEENVGSLARSKVSFDVFVLVIERLREEVEAVVNEQIIRPIVDFNFGGSDYPFFQLRPISDDKQLDVLAKWGELVKDGVVGPQPGDEKHIRGILEFPEVAETQGRGGEQGSSPAFESFGQQDFKAIERMLDTVESSAKDELVSVVTEMRDILIKAVDRKGGLTADNVQLRRTGEVKTILREMMRTAFDTGKTDVQKEIGVKKFAVITPREAIRWLDQNGVAAAAILTQDLEQQVKLALLQALKTGESAEATKKRLRKVFEPFVGDEAVLKDGKEINPARISTIIRNNTTRAYNQGRLTQYRDPEIQPNLNGVRYSAILDSRTTEVCRFLDGRVFKVDDPELNTLSPPNHHNCRSLLVGVTIAHKVPANKIIDDADAGKAKGLAGKGFV